MRNVYIFVIIMDNQITLPIILDFVKDKVYDELKSCLTVLENLMILQWISADRRR